MAPTGKLSMKHFRKYNKILTERKASLKLERVRLFEYLIDKVAESRAYDAVTLEIQSKGVGLGVRYTRENSC